MGDVVVTVAGCLGLVWAACAQTEVVPVWPDGKIPLKTSDAAERVTPSKDDIVRLTDVNAPTLTVAFAPDTGKPTPAVMICPGGGYSILAWNHEGTEVAAWLNAQGISAFILKYRVPKNRDAAFCDAQRALGLIRAKASTYRVDPKRIGIMGFSAGAHLSVRVSTDFSKRFYTPIDEIDEVSCRPDFALIIYPAYLCRDGYTLAPELPVMAQTPPTFLLQAEDDKPYVDSSLAYFIALKAAGVPVEMHLFPDGGHGYGLRKKQKSTDVWPDLAAAWLRRVTQ
ncbi:MAG TPA: alpha/beta hydrolase [Kiritimatiellia bacterium]|nr:alpha/beta hydrolase [Kiritimatiellia bacterium]HRU70555.1 alpha/beta hydrolase [Kiritimatiellia bacterium]